MPTNNGINNTVKITPFYVSGTWTKDTRTKFVKLYMWGGGGGGGSGRRGATTAAGGGGGGAPGPFATYTVIADIFNTSETVTVGLGGTGGAAQTVDDTNGNDGGASTNSSVGNLSTRQYGASEGGGKGGTTTTTAAANGGFIDIDCTRADLSCNVGGTGSNVSAAAIGASIWICGTSGGGGAGADSGTERTGADGGDSLKIVDGTTLKAGGAGGVESGTLAGGHGASGIYESGTGGQICGGTGGGGGGGQSVGGTAGRGGNGGDIGGGGGGGGGSLNGTNSGAGGDGGIGFVLIVEFF